MVLSLYWLTNRESEFSHLARFDIASRQRVVGDCSDALGGMWQAMTSPTTAV